MEHTDYVVDLAKICADIEHELARREQRAATDRLLEFVWVRAMQDLQERQPISERDAAAVRATEIRSISNGRPQFYIPDLGE